MFDGPFIYRFHSVNWRISSVVSNILRNLLFRRSTEPVPASLLPELLPLIDGTRSSVKLASMDIRTCGSTKIPDVTRNNASYTLPIISDILIYIKLWLQLQVFIHKKHQMTEKLITKIKYKCMCIKYSHVLLCSVWCEYTMKNPHYPITVIWWESKSRI